MGLRRIPPPSAPPSRPARDGHSESEPQAAHRTLLNLISYSPPSRTTLPSMVTNYSKSNLIELNRRSDDSCLLVISNKVYDLTLWLDEQDDSLALDELRRIVATDPVGAGCWLAERLGGQLESLAECRIGDFESVEVTPSCLDPGGGASAPANMLEGPVNSSSWFVDQMGPVSPPIGPASSLQPQRPSHLARALALVEFHKRRVIEAENKVGTAHVSLAEAFGGLAEAEKKRDHLVMLACEGYKPTLPEWEDFGDDQEGQRYASGSA